MTKLPVLHRTLEIRAEDAKNDGPVSLAISTEEPYLRMGFFEDFYEILDHSDKSIQLDRLKSGAALLFNHDMDQHLGVIDSPEIGKDKVLRGQARFSPNNALAKEKLQDVKDGMLKWVSVGYRVYEMVLEKQAKDGPNTYRVVRWEPVEVSLVTVPADTKAGVGRSAAEEFPVVLTGQIDDAEIQRHLQGLRNRLRVAGA